MVVLYTGVVLSRCEFDGCVDDDASRDVDNVMVIVILGVVLPCPVTVITFVFLLFSPTIRFTLGKLCSLERKEV